MADIQEVAITSCLNDPVTSVHVWDVQTGTSLMTYRGDISVTGGGVSTLCGEYIVAALQDKPFLRVWPVNSQQPLTTLRLVCPGKVTHAQASPDNCYIALTVAEKLHLFQIASGRLVGSGVRHFQPIRIICWSSDGSLVVCGGEDGLVTVWPLATLSVPESTPEPLHVLGDHTLPVTDIYVTAGCRPRLFSVSADRTCKIYDLYGGSLLVSVVFDNVLTAVTTSVLETDVFVGTDHGPILQLSLLSPPRHLEYHLTEEDVSLQFTGHSKSVRTLSVSPAGGLLLSGSLDSTVKVWHIGSRQCLRTLNHKGPITNAFLTLRPKQMFENELKPTVVLNAFKTINNEEADCIEVITEHSLNFSTKTIRELFPNQVTNGPNEEKVKSLQMEIELLRTINSNLYKFAVDKLITTNNVLTTSSSKLIQKPVKKARKNKKKSNSVGEIVPGKNIQNSVRVVSHNNLNSGSLTASVNGASISKKKRQRFKNKIKNKN